MTVADIIRICEEWAPPGIAWEKDNVGLQIGSTTKRVRRILLSLDVNDRVIQEAIRKKIDLIISHHPLFFRLPRTLTDTTRQGKLAREIIRHDLALYAMHTNVDRVRDGVSWTLAGQLHLQDLKFLVPVENTTVKIVTFVPHEEIEHVAQSMAAAGAGIIGKYSECSFRTSGVGIYRPGYDAKPWAGTPGVLESADETRLEMIAPRWKVPAVIDALVNTHPYEEPAYDVYPVENGSPNYGMGAIGKLQKSLPLTRFLDLVKKVVARDGFRYTVGKAKTISRVAVCGGSGAEYLNAAIRSGADAFITADISYHIFQDAEERITLIDAGHYETECGVLAAIKLYLDSVVRRTKHPAAIITTGVRTNPIYHS